MVTHISQYREREIETGEIKNIAVHMKIISINAFN